MDLSNLKPAEGSVKARKRVGRGQGSGRGGTATRGDKGAQSRSGYSAKRGFEGGQMPIQQRLPKRGFKNINRVEYTPVNLSRLQTIAEKNNLTSIDVDGLVKLGIVSKNAKIKVLGTGELNTRLDVKVHAYSASAKKAIEDLGGTAATL